MTGEGRKKYLIDNETKTEATERGWVPRLRRLTQLRNVSPDNPPIG